MPSSLSFCSTKTVTLTSVAIGTVLLLLLLLRRMPLSSYNVNKSQSLTSVTVKEQQQQQPQQQQANAADDANTVESNNYLPKLLSSLTSTRCMDPDFPSLNKENNDCTCPDPTIPRPRVKQQERWMAHHNHMVEQVNQFAAAAAAEATLDVLFLGDSITERWMGTKALGKVALPEYRNVFEKYFGSSTSSSTSSSSSSLRGMALGTGGDTCTELLWHLQNGLLLPASSLRRNNLQPRVIILLIGTNDLGLDFCNKQHVLAGILHVAAHIHLQRPRARLILHGLLPRGDELDQYQLKQRWQQIQWINRELQRFVNGMHSSDANVDNGDVGGGGGGWYYVDNPDLFLRHDNPTLINATRMKDALHPTLEGYTLWAPRLDQQIGDILRRAP